ncbi:phosphatidylglycerophosphatase and protein-tyrosine phosphatase 1-like isoform X1 [Achlya hypogyna]|uniref:Phosphatidylglycerophosphatase and protein-tyrosine phosphatase 1-like isoform X1 n=1 Tax=Achlya hypogyna TaxID=1202772 RepID=A0A1V9YQH5_ACHHY|nr:phosphatidylglycerophosphatase and protein-tyrosine phosphatase 1-like isoform X1 [Achlya hypogyna]
MLRAAIFRISLGYNLAMKVLARRTWWSRIDDHILLGALPLANRGHHLLLQREGVGAVVTMNEPFELRPTHLGTPVTPDDWAGLGIDQHIAATTDFTAPSMESLVACVAFVSRHIDLGHTVYVHCKAGRGRSTVVVAAYLMRTHQWSIDQALDFIKQKRPHIAKSKAILRQYEAYLEANDARRQE